ncbi:glycerol-3-phosphate dehydrogenase C-terminal domain-containing protein, partial [Sulfitobacter pontiacus]
TTYRRLAESALEKIQPYFANDAKPWTAGVALPGGDFPVDGVAALKQGLQDRYGFLTQRWADRLVKAYGREAFDVLGDAQTAADLGRDFGATLTEREAKWLIDKEFARTADDIIWRRSKLGLRLDADELNTLEAWMVETTATPADNTTAATGA